MVVVCADMCCEGLVVESKGAHVGAIKSNLVMEAEKRRRRRGKASVVEKERKLRNQKTEEALWFSEFLQLRLFKTIVQ
jgi:hypothetical protein